MTLDVLGSVKWVISQLTTAGLAGGRIYSAGAVPRTAIYPLITVNLVGPMVVANASADIIGYNDLVLVKAVTTGADNTIPAGLLNSAITALNKTKGSMTGGTCVACVLEELFPLPPFDQDGVTYQQSGAQFRVFTQ